ncbi:hypothetical protein [Rugamonas aquatica]|uniref:Uncharacterized protein n=1 Tax=Rugamonas aquatica TaxID=2743357 RepID=A0A6A7MW38_9BURK|nr:hypothetical protein [Rugamonas aquatica]MQA37080.1 hypothetical protein [Rugamonas aquatica]
MKTLILTCSAVVALTGCGETERSTASSAKTTSIAPTVQVAGALAASSPSATTVADVIPQAASVDVWADLNPETFRRQYDELAKTDGSDTIKRMNKTKEGVVVTLNDERFQIAIAEMKRLDLANGRFESKLGIRLSVNGARKVTEIRVVGDRSDPINLMRFIGAVGMINTMLNPGQDEKTNMNFIESLNLMRGDDDASIGQPVASFNHGAAFACVSVPSEKSTGLGCIVTPRS